MLKPSKDHSFDKEKEKEKEKKKKSKYPARKKQL
jgi:hypothetical protein